MIVRTLYVGFAVESVDRTRRVFGDVFGLPGERMDPDPFLGTDKGARIALPNECWIYLMESHQGNSPIAGFIEEKGPGLERLAFLSDDIEAEFERVRQGGAQLSDDALVDTPLGRRFVVPAKYASGLRLELIQPEPGTWQIGAPDSISGILGLQHIGAAVKDLQAARDAFERLLDLHPAPIVHEKHLSFAPGNDYHWIDIAERKRGQDDRLGKFLEEKGEGLEHLSFEVRDIREAVKRATGAGAAIHDHKIYTNRPNGFEAFIYPEHTTGTTVELIEPYPTSPGYRERRTTMSISGELGVCL